MNIKQSKIVCEKNMSYDGGFNISENIESTTDGKKITSLKVIKTIYVSDRYINNTDSLEEIKSTIANTLSYLDKSVSYRVLDDRIIIEMNLSKNQLVLLNNIEFVDNGGKIEVVIDTNTKSNNVITLSVGDNYTDGELMKKFKNNGYSCK